MAASKRKPGKPAAGKTTKTKTGRAKTTKTKPARTAKKAVKKAAKKTVKKAAKTAVKSAKSAVKKAVKAAKTPVKKTVKKVAKKAASKPRNRRLFDRRNTHIQAELDHDGALTKGTVTNLSLAGCLFQPRLDIAVDSRIKLKLAGETKPVPATVKGVSELGVHCLLHAGGVTLGNLAADLDDMALLMLKAARPHEIPPPKKK